MMDTMIEQLYIDFEHVEVGKGVFIHPSAKIQSVKGNWVLDGVRGKSIKIGDHTYIGERVQIMVDEFEIGDYGKIHHDTNIHGYKPCKIGHNAWIGQFCIIDSIGGVTIGDNFGMGAHSQLWSHMKYGDTLAGCKWNRVDEVTIGNDVWLVGHVIYCGVNAADKSMALVGSVVTQDMEENCVYAGVPAKKKEGLHQFKERPVDLSTLDLIKMLRESGINQNKIYVSNCDIDPFQFPDYSNDVSYFMVNSRKYTKRGTPEEIAFMKYLLPEKAKFTPL
jgi:acetyltransferase-like isoleucine patch superfamily enzyme